MEAIAVFACVDPMNNNLDDFSKNEDLWGL
jgi:hypothetical protein